MEVNGCFDLIESVCKFVGELPESGHINHNAGHFHSGQDLDQGLLYGVVGGPEVLFADDWFEFFEDSPGSVRIFGGIGGDKGHIDLVHGFLVFAFSDKA